MTLAEIIEELQLELVTQTQAFDRTVVRQGYATDLLSRALAEAPHQAVWVTLQAHANVVAVASVLELCAVIITSGATPDEDTVAKANEEGIPLLITHAPTFNVVGRLWELGVR
jgi:hypothetical protein